ncbi:MAG: methionine adenosyltransferase [Burkholderiales bacterium]|jgi:S-adenosylmethionine synthetase|nr:methionine adenosyltransferase [Burkholderiales bacterium]
MTLKEMIFTSESVTPGHPDKLCDQISDAAVDAFLQQDEDARIIVECAIATGVLFLAARFAAQANVDMPTLARGVIADVGYTGESFDARSCSILTSFTPLDGSARPDARRDGSEPAQEQANAFGFACRETAAFMPMPIWLAHKLARELEAARGRGLDWLGPDGKTQVAVHYRDGKPVGINSLTITAATADRPLRKSMVEEAMRELVIKRAFRDEALRPDASCTVHVNPGGPYLVGGPAKHSGLTGRKNGIDTYGEYARQSGAALSGKDPSRIDRIGAYAARHAAKNIVAAGLAERCEVHLSYAIGSAHPISVAVDTFDTGRIPDDDIADRVLQAADFRPAAIEARFGLRRRAAAAGERGFFKPLAVYGQVGRVDLDVPWEAVDLAADLAR